MELSFKRFHDLMRYIWDPREGNIGNIGIFTIYSLLNVSSAVIPSCNCVSRNLFFIPVQKVCLSVSQADRFDEHNEFPEQGWLRIKEISLRHEWITDSNLCLILIPEYPSVTAEVAFILGSLISLTAILF